MVIAFDNSAQHTDTLGIFNFNYTCTGSNGVLIVAVNDNQSGAVPTLITYGAQNLTRIATYAGAGTNSFWYLGNPTTGSNSLQVTRTSGGEVTVSVASYTGAYFVQPDSFNTGSGNTGKILTINTPVLASNCWLVGNAAYDGTTGHLTAWSSGLTDRQTFSYVIGSYNERGALSDSNGTVGTGSQGITWIATNSDPNPSTQYGGIVISLAPIPPPASSSNFLLASL